MSELTVEEFDELFPPTCRVVCPDCNGQRFYAAPAWSDRSVPCERCDGLGHIRPAELESDEIEGAQRYE